MKCDTETSELASYSQAAGVDVVKCCCKVSVDSRAMKIQQWEQQPSDS